MRTRGPKSTAPSDTLPPLHAVVLGSGAMPPLLILHGWGKSLETMAPLGERLAKYHAVHLIDLPGFGMSPWAGHDWGTFDYAKCLVEYLDKEGIREVSILGHSFGGRICLQLASRWPERIRDVVLVGSAGLRPSRSPFQRVRLAAIRAIGKFSSIVPFGFGKFLQRWHRNTFGSSDYKQAGVLRNTLVKAATEDQTVNAAKIDKPTLLLWGELDAETPVEMAQRLHRLIANSSLVLLPGRDHYPFIGNGVHQCAEIINEFLAQQDRVSP